MDGLFTLISKSHQAPLACHSENPSSSVKSSSTDKVQLAPFSQISSPPLKNRVPDLQLIKFKDREGSLPAYGHGHKTGSTWGRNQTNVTCYPSNHNKAMRKQNPA